MKVVGTVYRLAQADFRERTRRYSFLITLLGTLFFGFLVITGKWAVRMGEYRGEYNSAWVGSVMASASTVMLAYFGFYLVKNSLSRDRNTRVGEILAATPLSGSLYVASKFASNLAVLTLMATTLAASAVVMQLLLSPVEAGLELWALVAPFVFLCLPVITLVAAAAVLFESIRFLRGGVGNVIYFFAAEAALINSLLLDIPALDFSGFGLIIPSMQEAAQAAYPGVELGLQMGFIGFLPAAAEEATKLFHWGGIEWSLAMVPLRLMWIATALGMTGLAVVFFDRFDPARARHRKPEKPGKRRLADGDNLRAGAVRSIDWSDVSPVEYDFRFLRMWRAELVLMVKGYHWSWYLVALGLVVAQLAVPYEYARSIGLSIAWLWPLTMWSSMGTREARFNTGQIVFSSPYPEQRQFPAMWLAGLTVALSTGSGMMVRALMAGELGHLSTLLVGALFVPTLALFLGVVSGTKKLFEVSYLTLWYLAVNKLPALDFLGASEVTLESRIPAAYLAMSLGLLLSAFLLRQRQMTTSAG
jgi:hypothetical protein